MNTTLVIVGIIVVLIVGSTLLKQRRYARVLEDARAALDKGAVVIDARSAMEFSGGHHDGAVNFTTADADKAIKRLRDKKRPVVVHCASGMRSRRMADALRKAGFEQVFDQY